MFSNTNRSTTDFYLFLGFHNILLGLFPFFLPVYLYKQGSELSEICYFIGLTGFGFALSLFIFDKFRTVSPLFPIIGSFVLEGILLCLILSNVSPLYIALVNGGYSCLYWTIQRVYFLDGGTSQDSGRRFGNFQIYVLIVLKIGIFTGSLLLENVGLWAVSVVTLCLGGGGVLLFYQRREELSFPVGLINQNPLRVSEILKFRDRYRSKIIFILDGIFLYLESYFWVISLFLIVGENFVRLGGLVIFLAVFLGVVFYCIKNRIDRLDNQKVFLAAVVLYIVSWVMRGTLSETMGISLQLCFLLSIAFCTSFFRLALNKRFFDIARETSMYHYLFVKSYYSQIFLGIVFLGMGLLASQHYDIRTFLTWSYWLSGLLAVTYFLYLPVQKSSLK